MDHRIIASLLPLLVVAACSSTGPQSAVSSATGAGGETTTAGTGAGGATSSSATSSSTTSASSSSGSPDDAGDGCKDCTYGAKYWWGSTCICVLTPPTPNCITANSNGSVANACDDGNPCTEDHVDPSAPGGCSHLWFGLGSSCGAPELLPVAMQCMVGGTGEQCCPVDLLHPTCTQEGVQAECSETSVCLEGACWVTCKTDKDCIGAPGATCKVVSVGHVSTNICL